MKSAVFKFIFNFNKLNLDKHKWLVATAQTKLFLHVPLCHSQILRCRSDCLTTLSKLEAPCGRETRSYPSKKSPDVIVRNPPAGVFHKSQCFYKQKGLLSLRCRATPTTSEARGLFVWDQRTAARSCHLVVMCKKSGNGSRPELLWWGQEAGQKANALGLGTVLSVNGTINQKRNLFPDEETKGEKYLVTESDIKSATSNHVLLPV